ncbi:hypothetical protein GOV09_04650 [Candidatus Woesearchaeota archaeon]|nr:hypothetical protein [Candidatus Woesearchaeota archaeon]
MYKKLLKSLGYDLIFFVVIYLAGTYFAQLALPQGFALAMLFLILVGFYTYMKYQVWGVLLGKVKHLRKYIAFTLIFIAAFSIVLYLGSAFIVNVVSLGYQKYYAAAFLLVLTLMGYVTLHVWQLNIVKNKKLKLRKHTGKLLGILGVELVGLIVLYFLINLVYPAAFSALAGLLLLVYNGYNRILLTKL